MNSLELFSGAGGLAKGLELAGFNHSAFVEFNKDACATLRLNFAPEKVFEGDVRDYDFSLLSDIDIVAGGPPCQPFSLGGKHGAYADNRDMFPHAIRAIETLSPRAFIFENVKGLLRNSFSDYFRYIMLRLTFPDASPLNKKMTWHEHLSVLQKLDFDNYNGIKYRVSKTLVNAANYGVPQCRERVVIVGIRSDHDCTWQFPKPTHSEERLLWDKFVTGSYWDHHKVAKDERELCPPSMVPKINDLQNTFGFFQPELRAWITLRDVLRDVPDPREAHGISDHIFRGGARAYVGHTGSDLDVPAKTVKAGGHGVPGGENMIRFRDGSVRYFTVYEAKLIQTFPKAFQITGAWGEALRQIGNAVPVELGRRIGSALIAKLHAESAKHTFYQYRQDQIACVREVGMSYLVREAKKSSSASTRRKCSVKIKPKTAKSCAKQKQLARKKSS